MAGPAGGRFSASDSGDGDSSGDGDGDTVAMDAVEFCCVLAGSGEATGLLRTIVPF